MFNVQKLQNELSQSTTRIGIDVVVIVLYLIFLSLIESSNYSNHQLILSIAIIHGLFSIGIHLWIRRSPEPGLWRRVITIVTDLAAVTLVFSLSGAFGGIFYSGYLWIIVGNGMRFGIYYLFFAMSVGFTFLTLVFVYSSYWSEQIGLAIGLLIGIVILPLFYAIILRDLEETNSNLVKQKEAAEQADIAKSRFLAAASHDLRQPLQAQALFVADLYGRLHDDENLAILSKLDESIKAMSEQFNALLDISKLDAGVVQPVIKDFNINILLSLLSDEYMRLAQDQGLVLKIRCRDISVRTDPVLLDSVLRNLVVNAIRYTNAGKVLVGCRLHSDYVSIQVWDTGIGIKEEYMDDIFEEFFQIDNPSRNRDQGLGLGLSVVRRVARLLDCRVHVHSVAGKGSCFSIDVSLGNASALLQKTKTVTYIKPQALSGTQVIVIDDERAIQEAMAGLLESWGCSVLVAGSGEEMLSKLSQSDLDPEIIIADYRLSGSMTGVQSVAEIRKSLRLEIPAILITGDIEVARLQDVQESAIPFLHKPIQADKLRTLMHQLLSAG